ncbi:hypothetical protein Q1695_011027 [Nippostrongylus brasiliensis]|nr:hypothetical protein Q1695_011027 [Nippostrongylus brasiliensis]
MASAVEVYSACENEIQRDLEEFVETSKDITQTTARILQEAMTPTNSQGTVTEKLISMVSETEDVETPRNLVVQIFAWTSVTSFVAMVGMILGHTVFSSMAASVADGNNAMILACVLLPAFGCLVTRMYDEDIRYSDPYKDSEVRYLSLWFALIQGVFVGRSIHNIYVSAQPPMCLTPAAIAVCYGYMPHSAGRNRVALISSSLSAAMVTNLTFGSFAGSLTQAFVSLTFLYVAACGLMQQFIFGNVNRKTAIHSYQHALVSLLIAVKGLFFLIFGSYV